MRIALFGSTGPSGRAVLTEALSRGHSVNALVRNRAKSPAEHERLEVVLGDAFVAEDVERAIASADAVVSTLGARRGDPVIARAMRVLLPRMSIIGTQRLVLLSALGVGDSNHGPVAKGLRLVVGKFQADKDEAERLLAESNVEWTVVRPLILTNGARGVYELEAPTGPRTAFVSRATVARFVLDQLEHPSHVGKQVPIRRA